MARKACFENFFEKVSGILIADNVGKGYDWVMRVMITIWLVISKKH